MGGKSSGGTAQPQNVNYPSAGNSLQGTTIPSGSGKGSKGGGGIAQPQNVPPATTPAVSGPANTLRSLQDMTNMRAERGQTGIGKSGGKGGGGTPQQQNFGAAQNAPQYAYARRGEAMALKDSLRGGGLSGLINTLTGSTNPLPPTYNGEASEQATPQWQLDAAQRIDQPQVESGTTTTTPETTGIASLPGGSMFIDAGGNAGAYQAATRTGLTPTEVEAGRMQAIQQGRDAAANKGSVAEQVPQGIVGALTGPSAEDPLISNPTLSATSFKYGPVADIRRPPPPPAAAAPAPAAVAARAAPAPLSNVARHQQNLADLRARGGLRGRNG